MTPGVIKNFDVTWTQIPLVALCTLSSLGRKQTPYAFLLFSSVQCVVHSCQGKNPDITGSPLTTIPGTQGTELLLF